MKKGTAQDIFLEIYEQAKSREDFTSMSDVARKAEVSLTTFWYAVRGERKWTADNWLSVLNELGAVKIEDDKIIISLDGSISP